MRTILLFISSLLVSTSLFADSKYFAEIDKKGVVLRVIVWDGTNPCIATQSGTWVETKMDGTKNYAGIGYTYDDTKTNYSQPKPSGGTWTQDSNLKWQEVIVSTK